MNTEGTGRPLDPARTVTNFRAQPPAKLRALGALAPPRLGGQNALSVISVPSVVNASHNSRSTTENTEHTEDMPSP